MKNWTKIEVIIAKVVIVVSNAFRAPVVWWKSKYPTTRDVPEIPDGYVYLGKNGEFHVPARGFDGYYYLPEISPYWRRCSSSHGQIENAHFCAPVDSDVYNLNKKEQ